MTSDLVAVIRSARRRWRLRVLLHGASLVAAVGLIAAVAGAWGADHFRFSTAALIAFRVFVWGTVLVLLARFVVQPLWRRITKQQVALYLEEHEPSLDGVVLTALTAEGVEAGHSPALVERVIRRAVERLSAVGGGRRIERASLQRSGGILAGVAAIAAAVLLLGPRSIRGGLPFVVAPFGTPGSPYTIDVTPGDSTTARGADLRIGAMLRGFTAEDVTLVMRAQGASDWERVDLASDEEHGDFGTLLFNLQDTTEYFVTAGGVRSAVHRIAVVDLPYVRRIALEYHYPAYTGLDPVRKEDGGDIAALVGTRVGVEVRSTIPTSGGALLVGTDTVPLATKDSTLTAELAVAKSGSYRVLLAGPDGRLLPASSEYFIDALDDQPPLVRITQPGRDVSVTSVDEVFTEVKAEDDYGLQQVELVYAVNGGAESTTVLYNGRNHSKELTAGHTLYLEDLSLQPGDVIAYYARARDARQGGAPAATDIYFVTVRPFDRRWRVSDARGGQQSGQDVSPGELSERQREIVAATFRLVRDSAQYDDRQWRDNLGTVTLMQGRLREEVETLVSRLQSRGVAQMDSTFATVTEALPLAATAMQEAEEQLGRWRADSALPPGQRALQQLQRAEAAFRDRQVTRGQQGAGGGGNAAGDTDAEQLAELFELDLDRLRNQYESVERGQRQENQQEADEALEKLRELARRQQQENERQRARAMRDPSGGGSAGQRRLAQEAEELGRRLERLSRERSNPELGEAARRLQDAAEAMRRAAAAGSSGGGTAQGEAAVEQLRDARRRLEGSRRADLRRDIQDAVRRADRLVEQQGEIQQRLRDLPAEGAGRRQELQPLSERKQQMADEVDQMESEMDRLSRDARGEQPETAERLRAAVQAARDRRLQDKIRYSRGVIAQRSPEYAERFEEDIAGDLQAMRDSIASAAGSIAESPEQRMQQALERTRDLTRALESLGERARERATGDTGVGGRAGERQLRDELRRRLGDLRDARDQLGRAGADVRPLNDIIRRLGRLDATGQIGTPRGLDELSQAIVQGLKDYEFALRRALLGDETPGAALATDDNVPPQYRALVEEYYRRLAQRRR